jgi:hypothetical protein
VVTDAPQLVRGRDFQECYIYFRALQFFSGMMHAVLWVSRTEDEQPGNCGASAHQHVAPPQCSKLFRYKCQKESFLHSMKHTSTTIQPSASVLLLLAVAFGIMRCNVVSNSSCP